MGWLVKKERALGIARGRRRYDLPLNKSSGTGFLVLLICLMTFLATLALAASFALAAMTDRWTSGLENRVTVEVPARSASGDVLGRQDIAGLTAQIGAMLTAHPDVVDAHIMTDAEIAELVRPWLGDDLLSGDIPLPGLISLTLGNADIKTVRLLEDKLKSLHPSARIDTHESWLSDLLRFTGALQFFAVLVTAIIALTTVTAVAGAVRSRMAVNHTEVELLHLMGAHDAYISRQFQRHSFILSLQGALAGLLAGAIAMAAVGWVSGEMGVNLLPDFSLGPVQIAILACIPAIVAAIATLTARQTVLKVLAQMP